MQSRAQRHRFTHSAMLASSPRPVHDSKASRRTTARFPFELESATGGTVPRRSASRTGRKRPVYQYITDLSHFFPYFHTVHPLFRRHVRGLGPPPDLAGDIALAPGPVATSGRPTRGLVQLLRTSSTDPPGSTRRCGHASKRPAAASARRWNLPAPPGAAPSCNSRHKRSRRRHT